MYNILRMQRQTSTVVSVQIYKPHSERVSDAFTGSHLTVQLHVPISSLDMKLVSCPDLKP